jgi:hypothetical protein
MLLSACMVGCDKDESNGEISREEHQGRGSVACQDWQYATCAFLVSQCDLGVYPSISACLNHYGAVYCQSDETATACVGRYESSGCTGMPAGCSMQEMADTALAVADCEAWLEAACKNDTGCGYYDSVEECLVDARSQLNCEDAGGTLKSWDTCVSTVETIPCDQGYPDECRVLFLSF